jgi:hypothetical protein
MPVDGGVSKPASGGGLDIAKRMSDLLKMHVAPAEEGK